MSISVTCDHCGKDLTAKDDFAGRQTTCPDCGADITIPGELPVATAPVPVETPSADNIESLFELDDESTDAAPAPEASRERRPCPACGGSIVAIAAKCRFCGAVFDTSFRVGTPIAPEKLEQFRTQVPALGAFWLLITLLFPLLLIPVLGSKQPLPKRMIDAALVVGIGCVPGAIAIGTFLRKIWALRAGLLLSSLACLLVIASTAFNLSRTTGPDSNPCGFICMFVFFGAVVAQSQRVHSIARELRAAGLGLHPDSWQLRASAPSPSDTQKP